MAGKTILIVDDEKDFVCVLGKRLAMEGFHVISADNGSHALSMAKLHQPDLIMLDLAMPEISGGETAYRLKVDQKTRHIPVIFLSSLISNEESVRMKHNCGGNIILAKSTNLKELQLDTPVSLHASILATIMNQSWLFHPAGFF